MQSSLSEAPAGRHIAQFHRHPDTLAESAFEFLEGGLRRGNSVVILATPDNAERFTTRLDRGRFHASALQQAGQLTFLDAQTVLAGILVDDMPDWTKVRSTINGILERVRAFGRGTRMYCDLTGILWRDGNTRAAVRLEEHWNALSQTLPLAFFCGFVMDTQCEESYAAPLEELGRTHTEIVSTPDDDRFAEALDRASRELFGISLSQMVGVAKMDGERRFPSGQRTLLWVKRNLPLSTAQLAERARRYYNNERRA